MPIIQQIKRDAAYYKKLIARRDTLTVNGVVVTGQKYEEVLETTRAAFRAELRKLELILESGVIPEKYCSSLTKQTYYPSGEERRIILKPLPSAKHTFFVTKKSRKTSEQKLSSYVVARDKTTSHMNFFIEHDASKKYPKGGFAARVKKAYSKVDDVEPKYAVKIYNKNMYNGDTIHEVRVAMRAAYCYQQLGRESACFRRNNKQYMVTEWHKGASLDVADQKNVQSMPMPQRIVMAISLLRELSILHRLGLIHHDIKPGNVMIYFGKLGFVDLDSVTLKDEKPLGEARTPMYTDGYLPNPQMCFDAIHNPRAFYLQANEKVDLYQMGVTLIHLFQEVYTSKMVEKQINVNDTNPVQTFTYKTITLEHGKEYEKHSDLQELLKKMFLQKQYSTADECIEAFKKVLSTYPDHEKYLEEDRLVDVGKNLTKKDGENAFKEIEIELIGFNQRSDAFNKLKIR